MSSILKALKKLEDELPQENEVGLPQINTKKVVSKHAKRTRLVNNFLSIILITIILTGGAWFILKQKPLWVKKLFPSAVSTEQQPMETVYSEKKTSGPQEKASGKNLALKKVPDASITAKHEDLRDSSPNRNSEQGKTATVAPAQVKKRTATVTPGSRIQMNDKSVPVYSPVTARPQPGEDRQSVQPVVTDRKPVIAEQPPPVIAKPQLEEDAVEEDQKILNEEQPAPIIVKQQPEEDTVSVKEDQKSEQPAQPQPEEDTEEDQETLKAEQHATVEQIDDPRLRIQALVWSNDPESRMAMINDKIIRTGGTVEGIVVTHIDSDYVIVQEGDKKWKQMFKIK